MLGGNQASVGPFRLSCSRTGYSPSPPITAEVIILSWSCGLCPQHPKDSIFSLHRSHSDSCPFCNFDAGLQHSPGRSSQVPHHTYWSDSECSLMPAFQSTQVLLHRYITPSLRFFSPQLVFSTWSHLILNDPYLLNQKWKAWSSLEESSNPDLYPNIWNTTLFLFITKCYYIPGPGLFQMNNSNRTSFLL